MVLDDRADRLQKDVRLRMNQARHRFRTRFADLPEGAVDGVEQAVSERGLIVVEVGPEKALFQTLSLCPACDREAAALFLAVDQDSVLFDMELTAEGLLCGLCGFYLSNSAEVEAVGLPTTVQFSMEDLTRIVTFTGHSPRSAGCWRRWVTPSSRAGTAAAAGGSGRPTWSSSSPRPSPPNSTTAAAQDSTTWRSTSRMPPPSRN